MNSDNLHNCLFFTSNRLSRVITKMAEESFQRYGFSPTHAYLMLAVNEKEKVTPTQLAQILHMTPSTITRFVDKLVGKGFLEREVEGKNIFVLPTKKGREAQASIEEAITDMYKNYVALLGEAQAKSVTQMIHETVEMLEKNESES
ncbi:MarR family transcriptional regulator [Brevibacillus formosus]|uniref:MarR family transcriptional regulator n=1 Tax=Brevibacillus formosus TaxID=54913 RepID=A0A220MFU2_9BACL|nr:MarR family transcriptional regulator [Brevibacillus formosus]ASJ53921.1 MarR family transcriptional regulator [Brevibacillus formosus]